MASDNKTMGVFALAMISTAAVLSLRNFPTMAVYGWSSISWYLIGTILFIIPLSLASAELASGWPEDGGVYAWVRQAFGEKWGFVGTWCAFSQNLIWYPTIMSFVAATLAAAVDPTLANSKIFNAVIMVGGFWLIIAVNMRGTEMTSKLSTFGTIAGSLIPGALILVLWIGYVASGKPSAIPFSAKALLPDLSIGNLPFVANIVLMFAGLEMSGYYATSAKNPQRDFPRATFLAAVLILLVSVLPTLAIAWVIPAKDINLNAGIVQALGALCDALGVGWLGPVSYILLMAGAVASVTSWMVSPALGLGVIAKTGLLPPFWSHYNKYGIPAGVMILQGLIGTVFMLMYISIPSVNSAYWVMSAITTEVLIVMYVLIFGTLIRLRYTQPDKPRPYKIPGGTGGVWLVGGLGLFSILFSAYFGFLPPADMTFVSKPVYILIMVVGTVALAFTPFLFIWFRKQPPAGSAAAKQA